LSQKECGLPELKKAMLEVVDSLICIVNHDKDNAKKCMLKSIDRFLKHYLEHYPLGGSCMRVRLRGRLDVAAICSYEASFPKTETCWRFLDDHFMSHPNQEYFHDEFAEPYKDTEGYPEYLKQLLDGEKEFVEEIRAAIESKPVSQAGYSKILQSFESMRHMIHCGGVRWADGKYVPNETNREPRSMLVDYWWNIPLDLRDRANDVFNRLSSSEIESVEDLENIRLEIKRWRRKTAKN